MELGRLGDALVAREMPKGGFSTTDTPPLPGAPPLVRLGFYAEDRLVGPPFKELRAELVRDGHAAVAFLRYGGRIRKRI